MNLEGKLVSW